MDWESTPPGLRLLARGVRRGSWGHSPRTPSCGACSVPSMVGRGLSDQDTGSRLTGRAVRGPFGILSGGEVSEWLMVPLSKSGVRKHRGFESRPLRQHSHRGTGRRDPTGPDASGRGRLVDYGAALEMRFGVTRRGFESRPLRQPARDLDDRGCVAVSARSLTDFQVRSLAYSSAPCHARPSHRRRSQRATSSCHARRSQRRIPRRIGLNAPLATPSPLTR